VHRQPLFERVEARRLFRLVERASEVPLSNGRRSLTMTWLDRYSLEELLALGRDIGWV
jgi:hypothetical protein